MKTKTFRLLFAFAVAILLFLLWKSTKRSNLATDQSEILQQQSNAPSGGLVPKKQLSNNTSSKQEPESSGLKSKSPATLAPKQYGEQLLQQIEAGNWEWKMPISFYGLVLDERGLPVAGAKASFDWTTLSNSGHASTIVYSGVDGRFALRDATGKSLGVRVTKEGYYSLNSNQIGFEYALQSERNYHSPDPLNPVVYKLKKKGLGVDLIRSDYGVKPYLGFTAPKEGVSVVVNLLTRKLESNGQLEIQNWIETNPKTFKATSWKLRLSIPSGGFVEHNDEFPFMAPESGYISELIFPPAGATNVAFGLQDKSFYIAFGNPRKYGRLKVTAGQSTGGIRLEYAINPNGDRNLEPK